MDDEYVTVYSDEELEQHIKDDAEREYETVVDLFKLWRDCDEEFIDTELFDVD